MIQTIVGFFSKFFTIEFSVYGETTSINSLVFDVKNTISTPRISSLIILLIVLCPSEMNVFTVSFNFLDKNPK